MRFVSIALVTAVVTLASARGGIAAVEDFYKGKSITDICGLSAGGNYDMAARLVGKYLVKPLPGASDLHNSSTNIHHNEFTVDEVGDAAMKRSVAMRLELISLGAAIEFIGRIGGVYRHKPGKLWQGQRP